MDATGPRFPPAVAFSVDEPSERAWTGTEIAVVGMAGRFPGAPDVDAFWEMLREGRESSRTFTREELLGAIRRFVEVKT